MLECKEFGRHTLKIIFVSVYAYDWCISCSVLYCFVFNDGIVLVRIYNRSAFLHPLDPLDPLEYIPQQCITIHVPYPY